MEKVEKKWKVVTVTLTAGNKNYDSTQERGHFDKNA